MTRKETTGFYAVENGRIVSRGEFYMENIWAPNFWEKVIRNQEVRKLISAHTQVAIFILEVTPEDRMEFPEIPADMKYAAAWSNAEGISVYDIGCVDIKEATECPRTNDCRIERREHWIDAKVCACGFVAKSEDGWKKHMRDTAPPFPMGTRVKIPEGTPPVKVPPASAFRKGE